MITGYGLVQDNKMFHLVDDFGQLPPVGDKPMYTPGNGSIISEHAHNLYLMFENVVVLDMIMCQAGGNPEAIAFRALLMRMRDGQITEADWNPLLECSTKMC